MGRTFTEALTIGGQTYTVEREYDEANRLTKITYPDGTEVDRTYTNRDQLEEVKYETNSVAQFEYDDGMREIERTFGNSLVTTTTYRNDNLVASIDTPGVTGFAYSYDANKNKTAETISGVMSDYGFSTGIHGYDNEDRLKSWKRADTNLDLSWYLTLEGDWEDFSENNFPQYRTHGPTHELTDIDGNSLTYDAKGNLTQNNTKSPSHNYTWDFDNRLQYADVDGSAGNEISCTYDALGRRVSKTIPSGMGSTTIVFVSMTQPILHSRFAGQEIAEYTLGTTTGSPLRTYAYGSYIDEPLLLIEASNKSYYHQNNLFSVAAITDAIGDVVERYAYTAYGTTKMLAADGITVLTTSALNNPFQYTGRRTENEAALFYYRARMYDARLGRLIGRDPIQADLSLYCYVNNRPLIATDPLGLEALDYWKAASYTRPTSKQLFASVALLNGGAAFGDEKWPIAASFLAHALRKTTIANPETILSTVTHKDGSKAVTALLGDSTFSGNIEAALKSSYLNSAAKSLSCQSRTKKVNISETKVGMDFTSGDLHYALGHMDFNIVGNCDITMACKDNCCSSIAYSCFLSARGRDLYDFAWDPAGAGGGGGLGVALNNAAYVVQESHNLGKYYNEFKFKYSPSGSVSCP